MSISSLYPSVRPSLDLDFSSTRQLDPRVTFSRSSTGTYYDGHTSVLAEQNLLTYSQDFDNAAAGTQYYVTVTANTTTQPTPFPQRVWA